MSKLTGEKRDAIAARVALLEKRGNGRVTPEAVVDDARAPTSPLHDQFEWDEKKAAYQHNLDQARALIVSIKYVSTTTTSTYKVPLYWRDPAAAGNEQGYVSVPTLRSDEDYARDALVEAFRRVGDELRRAQQLAIALDLDEEVEKLLNGVAELRQRISDQPNQMM